MEKELDLTDFSNVSIQNISANQQLKSNYLVRKLMSRYIFSNVEPHDIFYIASNAVIIYLSVFLNGKQAFSSAQHVMDSLSLAQIAELSSMCRRNSAINTFATESGYNLSFPTSLDGGHSND